MSQKAAKNIKKRYRFLSYTIFWLVFWHLSDSPLIGKEGISSSLFEVVDQNSSRLDALVLNQNIPDILLFWRIILSFLCFGLCVFTLAMSAVRWHLASKSRWKTPLLSLGFTITSILCLWFDGPYELSHWLSASDMIIGYLGLYASSRVLRGTAENLDVAIDRSTLLRFLRNSVFLAFLCAIYFRHTPYQSLIFVSLTALMLLYAMIRSHKQISSMEAAPIFPFFSTGFAAYGIASWVEQISINVAHTLPAAGLTLDLILALPNMLRDTKKRLSDCAKMESKLSKLNDLSYLQRVISHDIAGPLGVIMVSKDLLGGSLNKSSKALLYKIESASLLIKDIIDFMRLTENPSRLTPPLKKLFLKPIIDEMVEYFRDQLDQKHLDLVVDIETDIEVISYKPALKIQLLHNVMSNAIKFSDREGRIQIKASSAKDLAIITITNLGDPIEPRLIQALGQQHCVPSKPGSASEKGLGYGLGIAMQTANLLGGRILISQYQSQGGTVDGTNVEIQLPRFQPAPATLLDTKTSNAN